MDDPFDLARFVDAQSGVYHTALAELRAGRKQTHWIWFILPQIAGLGFSPMAQRYAITGLDEARAYLAHPILGPRLRECVTAILAHQGKTALGILGAPDDLKFRSSLTLFAAATDEPLFQDALAAFFEGEPDGATLALLYPPGRP